MSMLPNCRIILPMAIAVIMMAASPSLLQAREYELLKDGASLKTDQEEEPFEDPFSDEAPDLAVADPLETVNRGMFWFNDKLYFYFFKPLARGFRVVPEPARISVANFFSNLGMPVRLLNCLLQLKLKESGTELGRFVVNSTVGIAGLFDPAKSWLDLKPQEEDFGQTLGKYGAGEGVYLVLPVFGPSSIRDGIGLVGDYFVDPISSPYYVKLRSWESASLNGLERVNQLSLDKDTYEGIKKDALDPYLFVRDAFVQFRRAKIKD